MLFIDKNVLWENAFPTIKNDKFHWPHHNRIIKEAHTSSICQYKKHNCLTATYRNILINNTKISYTYNNIKE